MNKNGFLCFLIVLGFSSYHVSLSGQDNALDELSNAGIAAVEAEKINFIRTLLEENTDFIIKEAMEEEIGQCSTSQEIVKQKINRMLLSYFTEMENCCIGISIEFRSNTGKKLGLEFMNRNSAFVAKKIKNACKMQYIFHGGITRSEYIKAEINGDIFSQQFVLPVGYSVKIDGVAIE